MKGEKIKPRIEVRVRLDFLALNPGEETRNLGVPASDSLSPRKGERAGVRGTQAHEKNDSDDSPDRPTANRTNDDLDIVINIPRESWVYADSEPAEDSDSEPAIDREPAFVPLDYISDSRQRIEVYRKLAQATDKSELDALEKELRDRFGPLPASVKLLLQLAALKLLAAEKHVTVLETEGNRLKLTRNNDLLMPGGKFPRLSKTTAQARMLEIKRLLLAI